MDSEDVPGHHKLNPFSRTQHQTPSMASYHRATPADASSTGHAGGTGGGGGVNSFTGMSNDAAERIDRIQGLLSKKLGPEYLSTRQGGGGTKLTYIEGWRVINLANEVFGFNGWYTEVKHLEVDFIDYNEESMRYNLGVSAIVRVWLRDGASHEDVGYGKLENSKSKADGLDKCKKEAVTDALKRTLRNFGSLLGNCLYDKNYTSEIAKMKAPKPKFDTKELHRPAGYKPPNAAPALAAEASTAVPPPAEAKPVPQARAAPGAPRAPPQQQERPPPPPPVARPRQAAPSPVARPVAQAPQSAAPDALIRPQTADFFGADDESLFAEVDLDASMYEQIVEGDSGYAEVPRELTKPVEEDPTAADRLQRQQMKIQQFQQKHKEGQLAQEQLARQHLAQQHLAQQPPQQQQHPPSHLQRSSNPAPHQPLQRAATVPTPRPPTHAQRPARVPVSAAAMLASNRPLGTCTSPHPQLRQAQPPLRTPSVGAKSGTVDLNISRPVVRTPAQQGFLMGGQLPALNIGGPAGRVGVGDAVGRMGGVEGVVGSVGAGFTSARGIKRSGEEYEPTPPEGGRAPLGELGMEGGEVKRSRVD